MDRTGSPPGVAFDAVFHFALSEGSAFWTGVALGARAFRTVVLETERREHAAEAQMNTPVEKARVSPGAGRKADTKRTPDELPVHCAETPLDDLSSVAPNTVRMPEHPESRLALVTRPAALQARALEITVVDPTRLVPMRMTG